MIFWLGASIAVLVIGAPSGLAIPFAFFAGERWIYCRPTVEEIKRRKHE
jgi:hypothetical protein